MESSKDGGQARRHMDPGCRCPASFIRLTAGMTNFGGSQERKLDRQANVYNLLPMAVYTPVTYEQVSAFLKGYDLGVLESFEGIQQGVSNTNYHLYTSGGRFILTLFEPRRVDEDHIPFFLSYAVHLAGAGIPGARAVADRKGALAGTVAGRVAAIMTFLPGDHPDKVTPDLCYKAGKLAAQTHLAGASFGQKAENKYGPSRWKTWLDEMGHALDDISFGLYAALAGELETISLHWPQDLPAGAIHADLFPDNVFFQNDNVSGLIDFHFACTDFFAYDLAIVINAWCFDESAAFVPERHDALLQGYEEIRPLEDAEKKALPLLLRGAALRFVLSRAEEMLAHKPGDLAQPHDPMAFVKRLEYFQGE